MRKWRVGTISMGLLLIAVGVLMIAGRFYGFSAVNMIAKWWPLILIMLGLEILGYNIFARNNEVKIVFDGFSIFATIVIIVVSLGAYGITEAFKYFPDHIQNGFIFSTNYKYKTSAKKIYSIDASRENKLIVSNEYGDTNFEKGTGKNIEVTADIEIRNNDEDYAKKVSDSLVEIVKDNPVKITSKINDCLGDRTKIKGITINYTIKVPDGIDIETHSEFGNIEASDLSRNLYIENTNGKITVKNIAGDLTIKNSFGDIKIDGIGGKSDITDKNGNVEIQNAGSILKVGNEFGNVNIKGVKGNAEIQNKNGAITVENVGGTVDASNEFGSIDIENANKAVAIKDKNGSITFETNNIIDGNVTIDNEFGKIDITIPENQQGHFKAETEFGSISNDFNLNIKSDNNKKSLDEVIGNSNITFELSNKNGNIDINKK